MKPTEPDSVMINGRRHDLRGMEDLEISTREQGGVSIERVLWGPKSHRIIIEHYSIWERGNSGECMGTYYTVCAPGDLEYGHTVEWLERQFGVDLDAPVPTVSET